MLSKGRYSLPLIYWLCPHKYSPGFCWPSLLSRHTAGWCSAFVHSPAIISQLVSLLRGFYIPRAGLCFCPWWIAWCPCQLSNFSITFIMTVWNSQEYLLVTVLINLNMPFCYTWLNINLSNQALGLYSGSKGFWLCWAHISWPILKRYLSFVLHHPYNWPPEPGFFNSFNSICAL